MKPIEFVDYASQMVDHGCEAAHRSAVSRGYYGAIHDAKQLVESCGFALDRNENVHAKVPMYMERSLHSDMQTASRMLITLREMRNIADYRLDDKRFSNSNFAIELA